MLEGSKPKEVRELYDCGDLASVHTISSSFQKISKLSEWISGGVYDLWQNISHLKRGDTLEIKFVSAAPKTTGKGSHPTLYFIKLQRQDIVAFNKIKATSREVLLVSIICKDDIFTKRTWVTVLCPSRIAVVTDTSKSESVSTSQSFIQSGELMAQFTAGGRLSSLFICDGLSVGFDVFHYHCKVKTFGYGGFRFTCSPSLPHRLFGGFTVHASQSSSSGNNSGGIFDEILEDEPDFEIDELAGFRGLVLDISYRSAFTLLSSLNPDSTHTLHLLSRSCFARPVNVVCWKRAICLEFMDKADVLEYYDQTVNSPSGSFYIPAVLRLLGPRGKVGLRGGYCSSCENLTIDHVLPIARGGKWTWENLVAACAKCNSKKGQKTLEEANMKLMKVPKAPKDYEILAIPLTNQTMKMLKLRQGMPEEWRQYLSKPYAAP
ncbi:hypothetical protein Sango_0870000 [Sesamum angolense]|uniref:HNH nuclease domain-containing protein n=1 Tax=Sesamum angolense TaxID=2727404 RepID=A0AAE1X5B6_9LAMI|nr:hypothetical protein Sango_0870000 [Sesamum angolense]